MVIIKKLNGIEQTHTFIVSAKIARVGMLLERFYDRVGIAVNWEQRNMFLVTAWSWLDVDL